MPQHAENAVFYKPLPTKDEHDRQGDAPAVDPPLPCLWGVPLKYISLVTLAVQNSLLTIIMHYSRVYTSPSRTYSASLAVLLNEMIKGSISFTVAFIRIESPTPHNFMAPLPMYANPRDDSIRTSRVILYRLRKLAAEIFSADCWKLSIPALLYVIQNNLQYIAASNLEAATFQVSYQMKILTTAAFSVLLLRKRLSLVQWLALFSLAVGVGIVQIQNGNGHVTRPAAANMNPLKGLAAVTAACFTSGLAGVYFEMVLKNTQVDLWVRNVQLSLFSLLPALATLVFSRGPGRDGWRVGWEVFQDFGVWAWATVLIQTLGGLLTALVIKYSDNILKGFATSLSIVISFLASVALFDLPLSFTFVLGSSVVLVATWLYNQPSRCSRVVPNGGAGKSGGVSLAECLERLNEKTREPIVVPLRSPTQGFAGIAVSRTISSSSLKSVTPSIDINFPFELNSSRP